jgi:hypothetical protein
VILKENLGQATVGELRIGTAKAQPVLFEVERNRRAAILKAIANCRCV